jgi:hypothetical protein
VKCLWVASIVLYLFHISELLYLDPDFSFFDFGESMVLDLLVFIISLSELMKLKLVFLLQGWKTDWLLLQLILKTWTH